MVDLSIIYSKTGKGLRARNTSVSGLSAQHIKVLSFVDGKSKAEAILTQLTNLTEEELAASLSYLDADGYIRPLTTTSAVKGDWALTSNFTPMVVEEFRSLDEVEAEGLEETEREKQEIARIAAEKEQEKLLWKAEIKARKEAEQLRAQTEAKEKAIAAEKAKVEAEENARREIERVNREAAAAEQKAQQAAEEQARVAAEQESARLELARIAHDTAEAQKKAEAEAKEKEAERLRIELAEKTEQARLEAERKAKIAQEAELESQRKAKAENDAQLEAMRQAKAALKAQEEAELARIKQLDKEQADANAKEQTRLEMANIVRKAEEERKQAEAAAKEARQEAKQKMKAEEQARIKAENKEKQDAEQALIETEEANRKADLLAQAEQEKAEQLKIEAAQQTAIQLDALKTKANEEERIAEQEKADNIRAKAEAEEQAMLDAKKNAQQEMARIAREADAVRAQDSNDVLTKPAFTQSTLAKPVQARFAKTNTTKIKFSDTQDFEDSYTAQENKTAKDAAIKAKNAVIVEAHDAENRENQADKWAQLPTKVQAKIKRQTFNINTGKWIAKLLKLTLIYVPLLATLCIGLLHLVNISPLISPIEKLATNSLGEPVTIQEVHASLWPQPHLMLSHVAIGDVVKVATIQADPDIATLFGSVKHLQSLTIDGLTIEQANVDESLQLVQKLSAAPSLKVEQFNLSNCRFKLNDLVLDPLDGKLVLNDVHALNYVDLHNADHTLSAQIKPQGQQYDVRLTAAHWLLPLNPKIVFDELKAHGILTQNQLAFSEINGTMIGGNISSKATLNWSSGWKTTGDFTLANVNTQQLLNAFASSAKVDGKANLTGTFASQSANVALLLNKPTITANVNLNNGKINGVDLAHAVMFNQRVSLMGNSTSFDKLTANLQLKNGQYQYKQIALNTKQLDAKGDVTVEENQTITGKVSANLVAQSRRLQTNFSLAGSISNVKRQ